MQRLVRLAQHSQRPPFPSSFFTSRAPHKSGGPRVHNFSDSSRSRPPSNRNNGARGSGTGGSGSSAAKAAKTVKRGTVVEGSSKDLEYDSARADQGSHAGGVSADSPEAAQPSQPWRAPASITPVPILYANPAQIQLDALFSLHRPLLEITVSPNQRKSASAVDRKVMDIVGESEAIEETDAWSWMEVKEYDPYLVVEPDGTDAEWGEGVDRYLASVDHTIPPPVPAPSAPSAKGKASSPKVTVKPSKRQKNIDYLFPLQAERRKEDAHDKVHFSHLPPRPVQSLPPSRHLSRAPSNSPAHRFLTSHLVKNQWAATWDWEKTRKALVAAEQQLTHGKSKTPVSAEDNLFKSVDSLRQSARSRSRTRARMNRARREGVFREFTDLKDFLGSMSKDGMVVINMPGPAKGLQGSPAEKAAFKEEIKSVIKQVEKFKGFFDKSSNFSTSAMQPTSSSEPDFDIVEVNVEWDSSQPSRSSQKDSFHADSTTAKSSTDWTDEPGASDSRLDLRQVAGPRTGVVQASRGRTLRRTLQERLALRGVQPAEQSTTVSMDSVKRKRKKRISKHKYKKRRKATRAERRKAGK